MRLSGIHRRLVNSLGAAACAGMMGFALFVQHGLGLEPCPLCIVQRFGVIGVGLVFLIAAVHDPGRVGARIYGLLVLLAAAAGASVSGRHVWLQSLPADQVPACGPGLDYILDVFPLLEAIDMIFAGSGECAEVVWRFLGLSMPGWVLVCFAGLGLSGLLGNWFLGRRVDQQ